MNEDFSFNMNEFGFDFLQLSPTKTQSVTNCNSSLLLSSNDNQIGGSRIDSTNQQTYFNEINKKRIELAKRISATDTLIKELQLIKDEKKNLEQQLLDFQKTASEIQKLYINEKETNRMIQTALEQLQEKYDNLDNDLMVKTFKFDQLQAQWEEEKTEKPLEYDDLVLKYLNLFIQIEEDQDILPSSVKMSTVNELKRYCKSKNLKLRKGSNSPNRQRLKISKTNKKQDQAIQCDLVLDICNKVEVRSQSVQCSVEYRNQASQHISTMTTRGTTTACFIQRHNVGTNFPEPVKNPSIEDILKEFAGWDKFSPVTPIIDPQQSSKLKNYKTIGTSTWLCNIRRKIDYLPHKISQASPQGSMQNIKEEIRTPSVSPTPNCNQNSRENFNHCSETKISNLNKSMFEEMWQMIGKMLLSLMDHNYPGITSNTNQNINLKNNTRSNNTFNRDDFHNWLKELYENSNNLMTDCGKYDIDKSKQTIEINSKLQQSQLDIEDETSVKLIYDKKVICENERSTTTSPLIFEDTAPVDQDLILKPEARLNSCVIDNNIISEKSSSPQLSINNTNCSVSNDLQKDVTTNVKNEDKICQKMDTFNNEIKQHTEHSNNSNSFVQNGILENVNKNFSEGTPIIKTCNDDFIFAKPFSKKQIPIKSQFSDNTMMNLFGDYDSDEDINNFETDEDNNNFESDEDNNHSESDEEEDNEDSKSDNQSSDSGDEIEEQNDNNFNLNTDAGHLKLSNENLVSQDLNSFVMQLEETEDFQKMENSKTDYETVPMSSPSFIIPEKHEINKSKISINERNEKYRLIEEENNGNALANEEVSPICEKKKGEMISQKNNIPENLFDEEIYNILNKENKISYSRENNINSSLDQATLQIDNSPPLKDIAIQEETLKTRKISDLVKINVSELTYTDDEKFSISLNKDENNSLHESDSSLCELVICEDDNEYELNNFAQNIQLNNDYISTPLDKSLNCIDGDLNLSSISTLLENSVCDDLFSESICPIVDALLSEQTNTSNDENDEQTSSSEDFESNIKNSLTRTLSTIGKKRSRKRKSECLTQSPIYKRSERLLAKRLALEKIDHAKSNNISNKTISEIENIQSNNNSDRTSELKFGKDEKKSFTQIESLQKYNEYSEIPIEDRKNNTDFLDSPQSPSPQSYLLNDETIIRSIPIDSMWESPECFEFKKPKEKSLIDRWIASYRVNCHQHLMSKIKPKNVQSTKLKMIYDHLRNFCYNVNTLDLNSNTQHEVPEVIRNIKEQTTRSRECNQICEAFMKLAQECPSSIVLEKDLPTVIQQIPPHHLSPIMQRLAILLKYFGDKETSFFSLLSDKIETFLFNCQTTEKISFQGCVHLTQLYLLAVSNQQSTMEKHPARWFIANCLYFYSLKAIRMIYEVLMWHPTTLPPREDRSYDRSDVIITVIQYLLMNNKYDMTNMERCDRLLLSKLRYEYHYTPFEPTSIMVIEKLLEKLRNDNLHDLWYAFALLCKRMPSNRTVDTLLIPHLLPLADEYYNRALTTDLFDSRIACLIEIISIVVKPFPIETDISQYLQIFTKILYTINRSIVQEAAVRSILRLQRFSYGNCYYALRCFKPTYDLEQLTHAMFQTFLYRKTHKFWNKIRIS